MKKLYFLLVGGFLLTLTMVSCQQQMPMDAATMSSKADSIAQSQMQAVAEAAMNECTTNESMMVQMKADSLYNVAVAAMSPKK
ncbi:MAG: hypothetical protein IPO83_17210 [Chitinophagaceae bacterium]|nr:hypothetical protein [Chitinophagaceae bacterium]